MTFIFASFSPGFLPFQCGKKTFRKSNFFLSLNLNYETDIFAEEFEPDDKKNHQQF